MRVSQLTRTETAELALQTLGLNANEIEILAPEGLCALLRRAASFLCPASPPQLVDAVLDAITPLNEERTVTRDNLTDQLEVLISIGDLLELRQREMRQLYLGPPSYVAQSPGRYLLLGIRPHAVPLVGETLAPDVLHDGHSRSIVLDAATAAEQLQAAGLHEIGRDQWLRAPRAQAPSEFLGEYRQRLSAAGAAGQIEGLTLIDGTRSVRYYRGRWRAPKISDAGFFIARRPQAYGADLWCLVQIERGHPEALIDLPVEDPTAPGRDEAWRLQAALDARQRQPQQFRVRRTDDDEGVVDLFSPVPGWVERYLGLVGRPAPRSNGSLFSYRIPIAAKADLTQFLAEMLWMKQTDQGELS